MAQYIYRIQPVRPAMLMEAPTEDESRIVAEHFNYLKTLMEKGIVILAGRTQTSEYPYALCEIKSPDPLNNKRSEQQ